MNVQEASDHIRNFCNKNEIKDYNQLINTNITDGKMLESIDIVNDFVKELHTDTFGVLYL